MQIFKVLAIAAICTSPANSEELPVYFHIESQGNEWNFDRDAWEKAVRNSGGKEKVAYLHQRGKDAYEQAQAEATSFGWQQPVVSMTTANLPVKNSNEFRKKTRSMDDGIQAQAEKFKDWRLLVSLPMCRLYEMPGGASLPEKLHFLAVLDSPAARVICYQSTMAYFATPPEAEGIRPEPVFIDPMAMLFQDQLPPFALHSAYLAHKDKRDENGRYLKRESNVYAPNEEIFLRAYFDNVRRKLVGGPTQSYAIQLDLEIRDGAGTVLSRSDSHYVYEGNSVQVFPVDKTQFYNHITAGIGLDAPGDYQVAFIFTDQNAPKSPAVEAVFEVTIK